MGKKLLVLFVILLVLISLNSCIGVSMDIQMRRDGSGRLNLEYRISNIAENLGRLDGNEMWRTIPVGRADWERTVVRLDGIRLVSFSSNERQAETVTRVTLEFDNPAALINFLNANGNKTSFDNNTLSLILLERSPLINPDLLELAALLSGDYSFAVSFSADRNSTMTITDGAGNEIPPPRKTQIVPQGRKTSFSIDMTELLSLTGGLGVRFTAH